MNNTKKKIIDLINNNQFTEAENLITQLLNSFSEDVDYNFYYGLILAQKKNFEQAIKFFKKTIDEGAHSYDSIFNIGNCYQALYQIDEAIEFYELCSIKFSHRYEPYQKLASCYQLKRDYKKALFFITKSIDIHKTDFSYYLYANILRQSGDLKLARENYEKSLKINNNFYYSKIGIARVYADLGDFQNALIILNKIKSLKDLPKKIQLDTTVDIGNIYKSKGEYSKSIECYKEVLSIDYKNPNASYGLALCYLYLKDYSLAWRYHEERLRSNVFGVLRGRLKNFVKPLWNNNMPKKTLLLWSEQGIGESILYSQFTDILIREFKEIKLAVDAKLIPFFKKIYAQINILNIDQIIDITEYDYHLPMGSIGLYFQKNLEVKLLEKKISYPITNHSPIKKQKKLRCGISWASGNKLFGHKKSISLDFLKDIFFYADIEFVNIQFSYEKGDITRIENEFGNKIFIDHDIDCYNDIDGVAELISSCDFIITVSNSNAHIAGKLGVKTFLLLPHSDGKLWYWGENTDKEILWYPSIFPIRQTQDGEWLNCISNLKKEIEKLL